MNMRQKRGQFWETMIPWIIAVAVIVLVLILYFGINGRLGNIGEFFKNWLRFGK